MPKLLLVERNGAVLAVRPVAQALRPSDVLVRMKLTDPQFWSFLLRSCDRLGVPGPPHLQSSAPRQGRRPRSERSGAPRAPRAARVRASQGGSHARA